MKLDALIASIETSHPKEYRLVSIYLQRADEKQRKALDHIRAADVWQVEEDQTILVSFITRSICPTAHVFRLELFIDLLHTRVPAIPSIDERVEAGIQVAQKVEQRIETTFGHAATSLKKTRAQLRQQLDAQAAIRGRS